LYQTHNHSLTSNPAVYHQHCWLRGLALKYAKALIAARLEVKDIITALSKSEHVNTLLMAIDITNLIQKLQALELNSNTLINALKETIDKQGSIYEYEIDKSSCLTHLFMASKACLEYAKKHPNILIINSIYKTNRFEMLLLNIISRSFCFYINLILNKCKY